MVEDGYAEIRSLWNSTKRAARHARRCVEDVVAAVGLRLAASLASKPKMFLDLFLLPHGLGENGNMPVKSEPKERPIIRMLLSACDNGAWNGAALDWAEEKQDRAFEVIATNPNGKRLALEHTLIQPFVGEKFDSEVFMRAFGRIEKNRRWWSPSATSMSSLRWPRSRRVTTGTVREM